MGNVFKSQGFLNFGYKQPEPEAADDATNEDQEAVGGDVPPPIISKATVHRLAGIKEAKQVLAVLPQPGETLHCVATARMDITDVMNELLDRLGPIDRCTITTLGYNAKNLHMILEWLDAGQIKNLTLCTSIFHRAHKGALYAETLKEFGQRGQRVAACHSHCKVVTMFFASGETLCIEGSANLCGNGSGREQFAMFNSREVCEYHENWILELYAKMSPKNGTDAKAATE